MFPDQGGITRSWNMGLSVADNMKVDVAITGNADTIWGERSVDTLVQALDFVDLAGPVSNRPGWGDTRQLVNQYDLHGLITLQPMKLSFDYSTREGASNVLPQCINGFTMAARMETWAAGAYDIEDGAFFNPKYKQLENEMELQLRWSLLDWKIGIAMGAYVHHYKGEFDAKDMEYRLSRLPDKR